MIDYDEYEDWLTQQGYRPSTITTGVADARQLVSWAKENREIPRRLRPTAIRLKSFAEEGGVRRWNSDVREVVDWLVLPQPRTRGRKRRKKKAQSFSDVDWLALCHEISEDASLAARVLEVLVSTGLRIGDVLRINRQRLTRAWDSGRLIVEVKGGDDRIIDLSGNPRAWGRLLEAWQGKPGQIVATLVCSVSDNEDAPDRAGGCAYKRVDRRLKRLAKRAKVKGRVHLHRLRRTFGVQALRTTEDVVIVQQLLGHRSYHTTMGYLDEARPERVAEVTRKLAEKYRTD